MHPLMTLLGIVYVFCAVLLAAYGTSLLILVMLYLRFRPDRPTPDPPPLKEWPSVVVQLPVYNEANVVRRLIDAAAALDYPRDRFSVQVLDDSDDHTSALVAARVEHYRARGLDIQHVRRTSRKGFKAGALAHGLNYTQAEVVALFDADFLPPPDFLRQTVPHLMARPETGIVQARWGHLNATENALTRAQALALDTHYMVEQATRSRAGLLLSFGGSAGIWRRACIEDAGGWQDRTVTEDLDLSYRAQLRGWRCVFVPHVEVPGEVPPQMAAYKRQQARWAKGTTQCLLAHGPRLFRSGRGVFRALMGLMHLGQYLAQPLVLILLVLTVPLMLGNALHHLNLSALGVLSIVPTLAYMLSQHALYRRWPSRLGLALPALVVLGVSTTLNNTLAVCDAILGRPNEFKRTPKFGQGAWQHSSYALLADRTVIAEAALAVYVSVGMVLAVWRGNLAVLPFFAIYALGCGGMVLTALLETRRVMQREAKRASEVRVRVSHRR